MNRHWLSAACICAVVLGVYPSRIQGQAQNLNVEQQLKSQYAVTRVGSNGVLVQPGTVLRVLKDGIKSMPASYDVFWPNNYKNGGKVGYHWSCPRCRVMEMRLLQVGEMVYLTGIEIKEDDLVFRFQSCGACSTSKSDQNNTPYSAEMSFKFGKGYLANSTLKGIQDTIGQVFEIVQPQQQPNPVASLPPAASVVPLKLPSTYVSAQSPTDKLQLNADSSFSLQEGGQLYHGTFVLSNNTIELNIRETSTKTTLGRQGDNLSDSSGQTWSYREQSAETGPSGAVLRNDDIIKLAKVGIDDATITAKIKSSKCQFDTSTDALVLLKKSGVSAPVLKAMIGAEK